MGLRERMSEYWTSDSAESSATPAAPKPAAAVSGLAPVASAPAAPFHGSSSAASSDAAQLDEKALAILQARIDKSSVSGYPEYLRVVASLSEEVSDPEKLARMALKSVATTLNTQATQVLQSVTDRISLLTGAEQHIVETLEQTMREQVGEKDSALEGIRKERAELEQRLTALRGQETQIQSDRDGIAGNLQSKKAQIDAAADYLMAALVRDRDNIAKSTGPKKK